MRFPVSLTRSMTAYMLRQRLAGRRQFPMVLMLEPLHACNLKCAGCGRIREYADRMDQQMSVDECLASIDECGAPIVSICGGEPLIYPGIQDLVEKTLARRKHIYLCTNGLKLEERLDLFKPSSRLFINVHLDGLRPTHDAITCRDGAFDRAMAGIEAAKRAGFIVYTNTTLYQQTDISELAELFGKLDRIDVDGFMLSPAYGYEAVHDESPDTADSIFMTRQRIIEKFQEAEKLLAAFRLVTSPLYMEFLCGRRELPCAAWANPTRNVVGWRDPCYLIADRHHASYAEMTESIDWSKLGPGNDQRCRDCMVHCGFEPSAVLNTHGIRDYLRMAIWQFT